MCCYWLSFSIAWKTLSFFLCVGYQSLSISFQKQKSTTWTLMCCYRFVCSSCCTFLKEIKKIFFMHPGSSISSQPRERSSRPWAWSLELPEDSLVETLSTWAGLGPRYTAGSDRPGFRPRQSQPGHRVLLCIFELNLDSQKSYKNSAKFPCICHPACPQVHVLHDQSVASKRRQ